MTRLPPYRFAGRTAVLTGHPMNHVDVRGSRIRALVRPLLGPVS